MEAQLLTPEQVARRLNVTLNTTYIWLREGRIPGVRLGHRWRVRPEALDAFLEAGGTGRRTPEPETQAEEDAISGVLRVCRKATEDLTEEDWESIPRDGSANLDHYLYGAQKRGTSA